MKKVIVSEGQNIVDLALQEYGDATAVLELMHDNPTVITGLDYSLKPGDVLYIDQAKIKKPQIVKYYEDKNQQVNQGDVINLGPDFSDDFNGDFNGQPVSVVIENFEVEFMPENQSLVLGFNVLFENGVTSYLIEKGDSFGNNFEAYTTIPSGLGLKSFTENLPDPALNTYRVKAIFPESNKILETSGPILIASSVLENFVGNYDTESGAVFIEWEIIKEGSVNNYFIERASGFDSAGPFDLVVTADALGVGIFEYPDFMPSGNYTYRVRVSFNTYYPPAYELARANVTMP